jgi:hypothetical protein
MLKSSKDDCFVCEPFFLPLDTHLVLAVTLKPNGAVGGEIALIVGA